MARKIICYLPGEAVRAIVPYDENPPASNFIPSFPASTSTFPWGKKKKAKQLQFTLAYKHCGLSNNGQYCIFFLRVYRL